MYQEYLLERVPILATEAYENIESPAALRFSNAFDLSATRENPMVALYDTARFHFVDDDNYLEKEVWDRDYARPETEWFEGMTHYQAEAIRDEYDYNFRYNMMSEATDEMNVAGILGYFAGAMTDPLNYLPWTRMMGASAKLIGKASVIASKTGKKTHDIADAFLGSLVGETALYQKKNLYQSEYDLATAYFNVLSASGIGAGVAGMRKVANKISNNSMEENLKSASKALEDGARGKKVEVDGSAPPEQQTLGQTDRQGPLDKLQENARKEVDLLANEPTVKAFVESIRKAPKALVDFINCRIG